jgi:hypothetical protein
MLILQEEERAPSLENAFGMDDQDHHAHRLAPTN